MWEHGASRQAKRPPRICSCGAAIAQCCPQAAKNEFRVLSVGQRSWHLFSEFSLNQLARQLMQALPDLSIHIKRLGGVEENSDVVSNKLANMSEYFLGQQMHYLVTNQWVWLDVARAGTGMGQSQRCMMVRKILAKGFNLLNYSVCARARALLDTLLSKLCFVASHIGSVSRWSGFI